MRFNMKQYRMRFIPSKTESHEIYSFQKQYHMRFNLSMKQYRMRFILSKTISHEIYCLTTSKQTIVGLAMITTLVGS